MTLPIPTCKNFTGYKPCFPGTDCLEQCYQNVAVGTRILIINLDAMGNVLATTSLLPAIKRKYPVSDITWITLKNAAPLLSNNPLIDRVYLWEPESWLILQQQKFDLVMNVDKSRRAGAFAMSLNAQEKLGFGINENGVIVPLNPEAEENYRLGLDDHFKFHVNQKTVPQIQCEELRLTWARDEYILNLTGDEEEFCRQYREEKGFGADEVVVGFNTGCSELYPNKKLTVGQHVALIERLKDEPGLRLALLGGPEDTVRNAEIMRRAGEKVVSTPTREGLRRGICYENICDVVVTGDSFGMHLAIGLKKHVIAWFGLSCWTEIDLFERGIKLFNADLSCSPCWKKKCPYNLECVHLVDLDRIVSEVLSYRGSLIEARALPKS